jgi:Tol biopolymer transport system component
MEAGFLKLLIMKSLLKFLGWISLIGIIVFISCKKDSSFKRNTPSDEVAGARPPGKGKPRPPVANAGPDQTIILPINTVAFDGSASTDPNNDISSYLWTIVSGPSSFTIANPNSVQTQVTNLVEGVYQFELKVTDKFGLYDNDVVQVTVWSSSQPSPPPCTTCKIVFVSARDGNNEIYTSNTDGSNIIRLTTDPGYDDYPAWSPDGIRIAFTRNRNLFIMNADGSNVVQRTFSGSCQGPTWSPDGTKIAYSDYADGYSCIFTVSATGGSPFLLQSYAGGYFMDPAWSPDGTKIAFALDENTYDYSYDIYTINAIDGTYIGYLTSGTNYGIDHLFSSPSWSPGGAKLAVVFKGSSNSYIPHVGVMNSDGSGLTLLRSGVAEWTRTSWSADGTVIVYTSLSGSMKNVSWVAANGSAGGTIVTNGWNADWKH